jgi:putative ATP-dependent endonuclease of the OLD family
MRLLAVHVKNYRCLADVSVEMADLTVLLGPNSAGKSSFLHALAFFFENTPLDIADVFDGQDQTVSVECTFGELTDADRSALGPYALGSQVVLRRNWTPGSEPLLTGRGRRFRLFEEVRSKTGGQRTATYKRLREERVDLSLPKATNIAAVDQAMLTFEQEHPDVCEVVDDPEAGKFLGYGSVGKSKLAERFPFVFVPAMRDAAGDAVERRGTLLTRLLTAIAEQRSAANEQLIAIEDEARTMYETAIAASHGPVLEELAGRLSEQIRRYVPSGEIKLEPAAAGFSIAPPHIDLRGGEECDLTDLGRQGHGFQRAFVISALEYLAETDANTSNSVDKPTLFLAIEEPELYQHPPRARHFASTLATLADSASVQVCYATHSPYFVSAERFDSLRFFRRHQTTKGSRDATVTAASLDVLAGRLPESDAGDPRTYLARTLSEQFREAFFAKGVLLAEGPSDAAVFETAAEMLELGSLTADGVVVTAVGGKGSQPIALAILDALKIPAYCVFDGDAHATDGNECQACGRVKRDRTCAAASNRKILAALGASDAEFPPTTVQDKWACFENEIEDTIKGFRPLLSDVKNEMGWKGKSPVAYATAVRRGGVEALPTEIVEILQRTKRLAG